MGVEVTGKTLGLIGAGNIGAIVASRALGLRMKVIAYDPFLTEERAVEMGVEKVDLDTLLSRADFVTLHTPLTDETRNILSRERLENAKKGIRIINCARGGLIDEAALKDCLESGQVAGAALDVFETEPPAADHPLFGAPNFICTPHLGASTTEAQVNVALQVAEQTGRLPRQWRRHQRAQRAEPVCRRSAQAAALHGTGGTAGQSGWSACPW